MKKTILNGIAAVAVALAVSPVFAADISILPAIGQSGFRDLSKEIGALLAYRNLAPAEPLGITGFDIGAEVSAMTIDKNSTYWSNAFGGKEAPSFLAVPKVRARKGLPWSIDIGGSYAYVPNTNVKMYGVEISKAILDGTMATPAVGVRATYTKLSGVNDLGLSTYGVDASVSKGFVFITPYAGAGLIRINSETKGNLKTIAPTLKSETATVPRFFGGIKITPFPLMSVTVEAEHAVNPIYSLKAAIGF